MNVPTGSLTVRSKNGGGIKWTTSSTSWLLWSLPVSRWPENLTNSPCCGKLYITWKASKVAVNTAATSKCQRLSKNLGLLVFSAGTSGAFTDFAYKPSILPHDDLRHLLLKVGAQAQPSPAQPACFLAHLFTCRSVFIYQAADGFLLVVSCDRAKILFISESVSKILNFSRVCSTAALVLFTLICCEYEIQPGVNPADLAGRMHIFLRQNPASQHVYQASCTLSAQDQLVNIDLSKAGERKTCWPGCAIVYL